MDAKTVIQRYGSKRALSATEKIVFNLATEHYREVVEAKETGLSWRQAGSLFELPENVTARIARRYLKRCKAQRIHNAKMAENDWDRHLLQVSKERLYELSSKRSLEPGEYALAKIEQGNLKGRGIFRSGDAPPAEIPAGNTTIIQNAIILQNMKPEEQEKLLYEARRGILDLPTEGYGAIRRLGSGDEEVNSGPTVVVEKPDTNI